MYAVSNSYKQVIYSGEAQHRLFLLFDGIEYPNANTKVEYVKRKTRILSNGEERFSLDNFVSTELEIKIHDIDSEEIVEPVSVSIGTLVNNAYETVPIGIFNLSETPTKDGNSTTIKLRDNSVKFDIPYNAEDVIENNNGSATMLQILQDICTECGVTLETTDFINKNSTVSVWDNSITARQYVMWIAEKAGSIATISRTGGLLLIPINSNLTTFDLDYKLIESFVADEKFIISRVVYEDGIRKFEYGELPDPQDVLYPSSTLYPSSSLYPTYSWNYLKQNTTLYIGATNPYITNTSEIENIYNSIDGFSIYGMKITKIIGNPALDPYDLIRFTYNGQTYITFAQSELTYNGVITEMFETNIGTLEKAEENVTVNTEEARFKRIYTNIDQMNGTIELHTSEIATVNATANNANDGVKNLSDNLVNYYTMEQTNSLIQNAQTGLTNTFKTTGGANIFRNTGLWFSQVDNEVKTGKNLFDVYHSTSAVTSVNVTFTRNNDGTITLNGTANANGFVEILYAFQNGTTQQSNICLPLDSSSTYMASLTAISGTSSTTDVRFIFQYNSTGSQTTVYVGNSESISSLNGLYRAYIRIPSGAVFTNYRIGIQVEKGNQATAYEPYYEYTNDYEFWEGTVLREKEEKASNMSALILQNSHLSQEQTVPNGTYNVSFTYKKLIALATVKVYINDTEYTLTETTDTDFSQSVEVNSQYIKVTFTCNINNGCEIYDLMVNVGDNKLAYSQNQNETTTDTVNISKGITITASDLDVTFKANADGIRTLDRNNNVKTEFTDVGMETDEAKIRGKSQIVGTLWQEVGDQTWITRL